MGCVTRTKCGVEACQYHPCRCEICRPKEKAVEKVDEVANLKAEVAGLMKELEAAKEFSRKNAERATRWLSRYQDAIVALRPFAYTNMEISGGKREMMAESLGGYLTVMMGGHPYKIAALAFARAMQVVQKADSGSGIDDGLEQAPPRDVQIKMLEERVGELRKMLEPFALAGLELKLSNTPEVVTLTVQRGINARIHHIDSHHLTRILEPAGPGTNPDRRKGGVELEETLSDVAELRGQNVDLRKEVENLRAVVSSVIWGWDRDRAISPEDLAEELLNVVGEMQEGSEKAGPDGRV